MYFKTIVTEDGPREFLFHMNKISYIKFSDEHPDWEDTAADFRDRAEKARDIVNHAPEGDKNAIKKASKIIRVSDFVEQIMKPLISASYGIAKKTVDGNTKFSPATPAELEDFLDSDYYADFVWECFQDADVFKDFYNNVYKDAVQRANN